MKEPAVLTKPFFQMDVEILVYLKSCRENHKASLLFASCTIHDIIKKNFMVGGEHWSQTNWPTP